MSLTNPLPNHHTGSRRLTLTMLTVRDSADGFTGLPPGNAKPMRLLATFQEAEPYLGLPAHAFKLISWLVKQTMPCDWEQGSRPIAWPSARRQQEFLCTHHAGEISSCRSREMPLRFGGDDRQRQHRLVAAHALAGLAPQRSRHAEVIAQPVGGIEHVRPRQRAVRNVLGEPRCQIDQLGRSDPQSFIRRDQHWS
jgi:hypothetical protein